MKKALSLLLACALLLSSMLVFTACGEEEKEECTDHLDENKDAACDMCSEEMTPSDATLAYYSKHDFDESIIPEKFGKATLLNTLTNMSIVEHNYGLILFRNDSAVAGEPYYVALNNETGEVVHTLFKETDGSAITSTLSIGSVCANGIIYVNTTDASDAAEPKYSTEIYTALGKKIAGTDEAKTAVAVTSTLFSFGDKIYEIEDDTAIYKMDKTLAGIPTCNVISEKYNYLFGAGSNDVLVYDQSFALVSRYVYPSNAIGADAFVMNDGNVIVQYSIALPDDAAEYDIYTGGVKYSFVSKLFNAESGEVSDLSLNFRIDTVANATCEPLSVDYYNYDNITNVAQITMISDKTFVSDPSFVSLSDSGKILYYIAKDVANQRGLAQLIADNRYIITDYAGKRYLFNEKAELIGEVSNAVYFAESELFMCDGVYYDLDLKQAFDESSISDPVYTSGGMYTVYLKTVPSEDEVLYEYYLVGMGKKVKLELPQKGVTNITVGYDYITANFYTDDGAKTFVRFISFSGKEIHTINTTYDSTVYMDYNISVYGDTLIIELYTSADGINTRRFYVTKR